MRRVVSGENKLLPGLAKRVYVREIRKVGLPLKPLPACCQDGGTDNATLSGLSGMDVSCDPIGRNPLHQVEIVRSLEAHPKLGGGPEIASQPKCRVGRDTAPSVDDLAHPCDRDAKIPTQTVDADPKRLQEILS
jgi:hypothetical protein